MTVRTVFVPPKSDPYLTRSAVNLLVSLEHVLLAVDDYQTERPEDVVGGLRDVHIYSAPAVGAIQMLERFAVSPRLRVWVTSSAFVRYGDVYVAAVREWLSAHNVAPRVLDWIGYTNLILANAVTYSPLSTDIVPSQITESDLFVQRLAETRRQQTLVHEYG